MRSVSRRVAPTLAVFGTQKRNFEYWGLHTGPRSQPYTSGEKVSQIHNHVGVREADEEATYLTGNNTGCGYNDAQMFNLEDELKLTRRKEMWFDNIHKYRLYPVEVDYCDQVSNLISSMTPSQKDSFWQRLFKDYPNFSKPLQPDVQEEFIEFYTELAKICHDEKACMAFAEPFVMKNYEQRFIHWSMWWRISEKLMDELEETPGVRKHECRTIRLVIERATKICYNVFDDQVWVSEDMTSPNSCDICGHRIFHEIGHW